MSTKAKAVKKAVETNTETGRKPMKATTVKESAEEKRIREIKEKAKKESEMAVAFLKNYGHRKGSAEVAEKTEEETTNKKEAVMVERKRSAKTATKVVKKAEAKTVKVTKTPIKKTETKVATKKEVVKKPVTTKTKKEAVMKKGDKKTATKKAPNFIKNGPTVRDELGKKPKKVSADKTVDNRFFDIEKDRFLVYKRDRNTDKNYEVLFLRRGSGRTAGAANENFLLKATTKERTFVDSIRAEYKKPVFVEVNRGTITVSLKSDTRLCVRYLPARKK